MSGETEELTPEEEAELEAYYDANFPKPKEKTGIFEFFNKIFKTKDTTKVANLDEEELRVTRILQQASLYAGEMALPEVARYISQEAEIILSTSDSKSGFLIETAITQKRQVESQSKVQQVKEEEKKRRWLI